jgi:hypothetical protein
MWLFRPQGALKSNNLSTQARKKAGFLAGFGNGPAQRVGGAGGRQPESYRSSRTASPKNKKLGILFTHGSRNAGYALFVKDGRLHYIHNYVGLDRFEVISSEPIPTGEVSLRYEFEPTGTPDIREGKGSPGRCQLYISNKLVGNLQIPHSTPLIFGVLGASCGYAAFDSVNPDVYQAPFPFTGEIKQVAIDVSGELIKDDEPELKRLMTQQ